MLLCGSFALHLRAADRGCQPAPGLPCALLDRGWSDEAKLGRNQSRGRDGVSAIQICELDWRCRLILRHCERSDLSAKALAKAEAIQKCIRGKCLDCFVARAP